MAAASAIAVIEKKRDGAELSAAEIEGFVGGVASGAIPDYQASAFLMAVFLRGMTPVETAAMTRAMIDSGARLDLSGLSGSKVDKHSTGGVGDKISIPLAPAVAACGGQVPMISGRSLGHTGGTLDKLEAIPGFRVGLSLDELRAQVAELGFAFGAATDDLAPADRKLYALRDATGTVASIPLITSSILSKKVAEGIDGLVMDVKAGAGAFLPDPAAARALAETIVRTGEQLGVRTVARITDMGAPLGRMIGNALEIRESIEVLSGGGPDDVVDLVCALGGEMLMLSGISTAYEDAAARIRRALQDGSARELFRKAVERQGGDPAVVDHPDRLPRATRVELVKAPVAGYVTGLDARAFGVASGLLGAGRQQITDIVDPAVGVCVLAPVGAQVQASEPVLEIHYNDPARLADAVSRLEAAITFGDKSPAPRVLLIDRIAAGASEHG